MSKKTQTPPKTFEEALAELEQILADIEAGEVGLEQSLTITDARVDGPRPILAFEGVGSVEAAEEWCVRRQAGTVAY